MSPQLTLMVVDDHKIFRQGIIASLKSFFSNSTLLEAASGKECISLLEIHKPDIIFMDIRMPVMDGMETSRLILQQHPDQKIIVLSMYEKDTMAIELLDAGAVGYLLKTDDGNDFKQAVETVLRGELHVSRNVTKMPIQ